MSLINEALKKAQKQRAHEPIVAVPAGGPPPRVAKRKDPMPAQTLVVIGGVCLALILALAGGAWFVLKQSSSQLKAVADSKAAAEKHAAKPPHPTASADPATPSTTLPAASPTTTPAASPTAANTAATAQASPSPAPTPLVAATTAPTPETRPTTVAGTSAPAAGTPAPVAATLTAAPAPVEVIQITAAHLTPRIVPPNPQALAVVDTFKVSGIRASANDPKVLMNDRVFRVNDVVERTYGLRLTEVHADRLTFVDELGATYTKTF